MSILKYLVFSTAIGILIPIAWFVLHYMGPAWLTNSLVANLLVSSIWPSHFFLIGDPTDTNVRLQTMSVAVNGIVYGIFGALVWAGRRWPTLGLWPAGGFFLLIEGVLAVWILGIM